MSEYPFPVIGWPSVVVGWLSPVIEWASLAIVWFSLAIDRPSLPIGWPSLVILPKKKRQRNKQPGRAQRIESKRSGAERSGAERSGAERSAAQRSAAQRVVAKNSESKRIGVHRGNGAGLGGAVPGCRSVTLSFFYKKDRDCPAHLFWRRLMLISINMGCRLFLCVAAFFPFYGWICAQFFLIWVADHLSSQAPCAMVAPVCHGDISIDK